MKVYIKDLYKKLSENIGGTSEPFHFDYFKLEDGELYYRGRNKPLTYGEGEAKIGWRDKEDIGQRKTSQIRFFLG